MSFEWAFIKLPRTFEVAHPAALGIDAGPLRLGRNAELDLTFEVERPEKKQVDEKSTPGTLWTGESLVLSGPDQRTYRLDGVRVTDRTSKSDSEGDSRRIAGRAHRLTTTLYQADATVVTEWLCNLPSLHWPSSTAREGTSTSRTRTRKHQKWTDKAGTENSSHSSDHILLELSHPRLSRVVFGRVPEHELVDDTNVNDAGFLEFTGGSDGLPDQDLRRTVLRALEFLIGRGLGKVGVSHFDADGQCISASVESAYIPGGRGAALPPALLHPTYLHALDPKIVGQFVAEFVNHETSLNLNRAVWLYLNARDAPLDMTAGYVGAAFEILVRGYYARPANKARSQLIEKGKWKRVEEQLKKALDVLAEGELKEAASAIATIKSRLGNLSAVSGTKLNTLFLDDLGLEHSEVEQQALRARNDAAHANPVDPSSYTRVLRGYRSLHTLFARALFSVLGVPVRYFDYSAIGHQARPLADCQAGTALPDDSLEAEQEGDE